MLPEWSLQGAILGLQGGTDKMLQILDDVKSLKFYYFNN